MKKKMNGGIEGIVATIIMAGLVIALIIAVILPMTRETTVIGDSGKNKMTELEDKLGGS